MTLLDRVQEYIRARGLNPEQILTRDALQENATTIVDQDGYQLQKPRHTFRELVHQDVERYTSAG